MTIINRIWRWLYKRKNIAFKKRKALNFSQNLKGDVMYISNRVKRASSRNQAEEISRIFIFQDLIKKDKFSTPA